VERGRRRQKKVREGRKRGERCKIGEREERREKNMKE
jgi:hypothetical protein